MFYFLSLNNIPLCTYSSNSYFVDSFRFSVYKVMSSENSNQFLFNLFIDLFIFGCVGSSLLCTGLLCLRQAGATLHCGARASHCGVFSCCGAQALGMQASVVVACRLSSCGSRALDRRLSSWGSWA